MTVAMLLLAVLAAHLSALGRAWWGPWAPDPFVPLAALLALQAPRRLLPLAALLLGGLRAVVLVEPAGGQVLPLLLALGTVAALRERLGRRAILRASLIVASVWWLMTALLASVLTRAPQAGPELFTGAAMLLPLPVLVRLVLRRRLGAT